jgi:glutaredoxin 3
MAWLDARNYTYEKLEVIENPEAMKEMKELTGQTSAPCMEVDGLVLADFGVDELEVFWKKHGFEM